MRKFFAGKSALITGASSGIGEELALQLARVGARLTLAARRKDLLESLADRIAREGHACPAISECDVARDGDPEAAVAAAMRQWGKLDIAFANAGFGVTGAFEKLTLDDYRRQFETNLFGLMRTVYAALPEIKKTKGNVVLVSSVAGWVSTPRASPYSMSKFAVRALANAITPELAPSGVKVTLISPGFVVSNIRRVDKRNNFHPGAADSAPEWIQMSTEKCARQILCATARGQREKIITMHGKLFVAIERLAPWLNRALAARPRR